MKIAIIIPARGNSKNIPQKNMRLLGNKPLLSYPIANALELKKHYDLDIAVTSEDQLTEEYVKTLYKDIYFIRRAGILARDETPLDPVIYNATILLEEKTKKKYDYILVMLATTPLLSIDTILKAFNHFEQSKYDSLVLVAEHRHIFWNNKKELITEAKNRQYLEPIFEEIGGISITKRKNLMGNKKRISGNIDLWVCPPDEAIDINNWEDMILAKKFIKRKKICFSVVGNYKKGIGHVRRCITLALRFIEHEIYFFINKKDKEAIDLVESFYFKIVIYTSLNDLLKKIEEYEIDAVINDAPDGINSDFASGLLLSEIPVVSINEIKSGLCDLIINPELEFTGKPLNWENMLSGYRYNIVREDIMMFPIKECPEEIKNIVITMGGSDPNDVTLQVLNHIKELKDKKIKVVIGKYFSKDLKEKIKNYPDIETIEDAKFMGSILYNADLVITSNSSNVSNCVCIGVFTIAISKSLDEIEHLFPHLSEAVCYLGYYENFAPKNLINAIEDFENCYIQMEYHNALMRYAIEIRKSQHVIKEKIKEVIG